MSRLLPLEQRGTGNAMRKFRASCLHQRRECPAFEKRHCRKNGLFGYLGETSRHVEPSCQLSHGLNNGDIERFTRIVADFLDVLKHNTPRNSIHTFGMAVRLKWRDWNTKIMANLSSIGSQRVSEDGRGTLKVFSNFSKTFCSGLISKNLGLNSCYLKLFR